MVAMVRSLLQALPALRAKAMRVVEVRAAVAAEAAARALRAAQVQPINRAAVAWVCKARSQAQPLITLAVVAALRKTRSMPLGLVAWAAAVPVVWAVAMPAWMAWAGAGEARPPRSSAVVVAVVQVSSSFGMPGSMPHLEAQKPAL